MNQYENRTTEEKYITIPRIIEYFTKRNLLNTRPISGIDVKSTKNKWMQQGQVRMLGWLEGWGQVNMLGWLEELGSGEDVRLIGGVGLGEDVRLVEGTGVR